MTHENEVRILGLTEEGKENVDAVSKLLSEGNLKWTNIESESVFATKSFKDDVMYVIDPTEGPEVDYLVNLGYPVIGPQCAITILKHNIKLTPSVVYPVHNLTMYKTQICFSNINAKERETYRNKVERMGGNCTKTLINNTTHLVVKEVGSVKYFSAASYNIPIMTSQWLDHLWTHGQSRYISALQRDWEEFKCPIFLGCVVCATGFPLSKRDTILNLVTKFGGVYNGNMKIDETTHLVVNKPQGQKYNSANQFGVKVVSIDWVYKSVEKKYCQDHNKYPFKTNAKHECSVLKSSTPEKKTTIRNKNPAIHDVSNISVMMVNETVSTSMAEISRMSSSFLPPNTKAKEDLFKFPIAGNYDQILDNICVYVVGFTSKEEEKIKQLLSISGATRFNQLTPSITHILVGSSSGVTEFVLQSIKQALNQKDRELWIISYKWLLRSLESSDLKPELEFWCEDLIEKPNYLTASTTIDETAFNSRSNTTLKQTTMAHKDTTVTEDNFTNMQDVLSQYMDNNNDDNDVTMGNNDVTNNNSADESNYTKYQNAQSENKSVDSALLFHGKSFIFYGIAEEIESEKCSDIEACAGVMLSAYSKKIPDYAIVPITGWPVEKTVGNIVTAFWLDSCISEGQLLQTDFHPMFTPFLISEDCLPLTDCVLCLSLYTDPLRDYISEFIQDLGGIYQETVSKIRQVSDTGEILHRITHLVVPEPEGDKFEGCQKWGITCVNDEWIYECARKGEKVPEEKFLMLPGNEEDIATTGKKQGFNDIVFPPKWDEADEIVKKYKKKFADEKIEKGKTGSNKEGKMMTITPAKKRTFNDIAFPPKWDEADEIARKYKKKFQDQKLREEKTETPLRTKFRRMNVKTPCQELARNPQNISFNLDECFKMLKTPDAQKEKIRQASECEPETPVCVFVKRFLKESIRQKYETTKSEVVKNFLFDLVNNDDDKQDTSTADASKNDVSELCLKLNESENPNDETRMDQDGSYIENNGTNFENDETNLENDGTNLENDETNLENDETDLENDETDLENDETQNEVEPLKGVVLFVAKKLGDVRTEQNAMTRELGGEFRWNYDSTVSHFVYQGKQIDKEFRKAKSDGKAIVSPCWLQACFETKTRVSEAEYPHLYNPDKSIGILNMSQSQSSLRLNASARKQSTKKSDENKNNSTAGLQSTANSQEARENLRKTVANIISSTTRSSANGHRLSVNREPYASPVHLLKRTPSAAVDAERKPESQSQDVQVSWDDPTERKELERIKKEWSMTEKKPEVEAPPSVEIVAELPPAFDADSSRMSQILREGKTPVFLVSSVTAKEKASYAKLIEGLGGIYLNKDGYDRSCTHLVVKKAVRNEKFLSCLAAGKWILHTGYMSACQQAGRFVKETEFEYGNPAFSIEPQTQLERRLMAGAHRWRKRLQSGDDFGSFDGWKVLLHINERQLNGFTRLLESGNGVVVASSLPYNGALDDVTHAVIEPSRLNDSIDIMPLLEANIHCCKTDYIAEHLIMDPQPDPASFYIPQVKEILKNLSIGDASVENIK